MFMANVLWQNYNNYKINKYKFNIVLITSDNWKDNNLNLPKIKLKQYVV